MILLVIKLRKLIYFWQLFLVAKQRNPFEISVDS